MGHSPRRQGAAGRGQASRRLLLGSQVLSRDPAGGALLCADGVDPGIVLQVCVQHLQGRTGLGGRRSRFGAGGISRQANRHAHEHLLPFMKLWRRNGDRGRRRNRRGDACNSCRGRRLGRHWSSRDWRDRDRGHCCRCRNNRLRSGRRCSRNRRYGRCDRNWCGSRGRHCRSRGWRHGRWCRRSRAWSWCSGSCRRLRRGRRRSRRLRDLGRRSRGHLARSIPEQVREKIGIHR